jgi:hypothetical protein
MLQMIIRRPLSEFKLSDEHRIEPPTILHFRRRQPLPPSPASIFRKMGKGTFRDLQPEGISALAAPAAKA